MRRSPNSVGGFTLLELFTVVVVIAILFGIAFPSYISVLRRARKTQAQNELSQIVTAVNAFYTEYGQYPLVTADKIIAGSTTPSNADLFYTLRAVSGGLNLNNAVNTRAIVYIQPPISKTGTKGGVNSTTGTWYDPYGSPYVVMIDGNYDNQLANPYSASAGPTPNLQAGVIAWSFGIDLQSQSVPGPAPDKNKGTNADDVLSWW